MDSQKWIESLSESVVSYRRMVDGSVEQISDDEFFRRPFPNANSIAVILRHLGGDLRSRWTDFLTTDGEKPDRNRDAEFMDWDGDRESLMAYFDEGWQTLESAIASLDESNMGQTIQIRGEAHSLPQALHRSLAHIAYHVGQIVLVARFVHDGDWKWLTIAPGQSVQHNKRTWGTAASRATFGESSETE